MIDMLDSLTDQQGATTSQTPAWNDPQFPPDRWQRILMANLHYMHSVAPRSPEWNQAKAHVDEAIANLNKHEESGVDATRWHSAPGELAAAGKGVLQGIEGIPKGLATMLHQLGQGDVIGAGKGIAQGLAQVGKGAIAPWESALSSLSGNTPTDEALKQSVQQGGQSIAGLAAMDAPARIAQGLKALRAPASAVAGGATESAAATGEAAQAGSVTTPAQPLTPLEGAVSDLTGKQYGYSAEGPPTPSVTPAMRASSAMRGFEDPVEGMPKAGVGGKSVQFGQGVSPGFKSGVLEQLGQMARQGGDFGRYSEPGLGEGGFTTPEVLSFLLGRSLGGGAALGALKNLPYGDILQKGASAIPAGAALAPDSTR